MSWNPPMGRPNCSRVFAYSTRRLETRPRRAHRAPHDAVARVGQTAERAAQPGDLRQDGVGGQPHVVEHEFAGHDGPQGPLVLDLRGGETGGAGRHDEAPDPFLGLRPHHGDAGDRPVGDPHLPPVEHPVGAVPLGVRPHAGRVGSVVGLGEPEAPDDLAGGHAGQPLRFCSSEPNRWTAYMARDPCTETSERIPESAASSSRQASPYCTALAPAHPYPLSDIPSAPIPPSSRASSRITGSSPLSYHSATYGSTRSAAQPRTVSRIARSSSSSRSSIPSGSAGSKGGRYPSGGHLWTYEASGRTLKLAPQ